MWQFILGSAGFLLYFIYDINSIKKKNTFFQKFFAWGTVLVALSLVMELWLSWGQCQHRIGRIIGFGTGALCFLALLIYTLFFALPFEETYCEENKLRAAYTEGVYGLCRHPGVLWFAGAYLCMWGMIFWNYLYIIFQDLWTFPQTFFNYREYQKTTPFLMPNRDSIKKCLYSIRKQ